MLKRPEILSPAGNMEKLIFALEYGADAVYVAGKNYSLRNFSGNFDNPGLEKAVEYVHSKGKKIYAAVNIFPHNTALEGLREHIAFLAGLKIDALIISDLGVLSIAKQEAPRVPVHISVQANNVNYRTVEMWGKLGAVRVILARELSFGEIRQIKEKVPEMEIEIFVHGAMCMSYSGRCLLSNYMAGRDANAGECAQSCRWSYELTEEKRPGERIRITQDEKGTYLFNSKDLRTIEKIEEFIKIGVDSFKIEGRMKSVHYVAVTAAAYKKGVDDFLRDVHGYKTGRGLIDALDKISHREYTTGFYFDDGKLKQNYKTSDYSASTVYMGYVLEAKDHGYTVKTKNTIRINDEIEILNTSLDAFPAVIKGIKSMDGIELTHTKGDGEYVISMEFTGEITQYSILRKSVQ